MLSVCMATYNGGRFLREQLESILSQLDDGDELIISDDSSTDDTISIIESFHDSRIKLFYNEKHGVNQNFENALIHSKGDIICLSDQDDVWRKGKVDFVRQAMKNYDLVVHNAEIVDSNGNSLGYDYFSLMPQSDGFWANLWKSRFLGCCMAFNREILDEALPFPPQIAGHDYWIGMLGAAKYRVLFDKQIFLSYRRHGGNTSTSAEPSDTSWFYRIVEKRMGIVWCVAMRNLKK